VGTPVFRTKAYSAIKKENTKHNLKLFRQNPSNGTLCLIQIKHLNYGIVSWGRAGETALKPLKHMHQKIIKINESKSISNCSSNPPSKILLVTKRKMYELEIGKFNILK